MRFDPEATVLLELRSDGVPLELAGGRTEVLPAHGQKAASPRYVVLSVWAVLAAMCLYAAGDLRAAVRYDEGLARSAALVALVDGVHALSSALGPAHLKAALDGLFSPIKSRTADEFLAALEDGGASDASTTGGGGGAPVAPLPRTKTPDSPKRVLLVGASSIEFYLGAELERRLEQYEGVEVRRFGKLGTGLARPDTFDWPKQLKKLIDGFQPDVVIGQFGGNDGQPLAGPGGRSLMEGTPEWGAQYARLVTAVAELVQQSGATMIMLGMQVTRHKKHSERLKRINAITQQATEAAGGLYVPTWDLAANEKNEAREQISFQGKTAPMYLGDGVHYARLGAAFVAQKLSWRLERVMNLVPKDRALSAARVLKFESKALGRTASYLAFVPQGLEPKERLPVLYVLHGADASSADISDKAHELLQKLASQHRLVLVLPDADPKGWYLDSDRLPKARSESFVLKELLPHVEKSLPVSERRGISGISMGGNGAMVLALKAPGAFVSVSSLSGAVDLSEAKQREALIERLGSFEEKPEAWLAHSAVQLVEKKKAQAKALPVLLTVGTEDRWLNANRNLAKALEASGADSKLKESRGGHTWELWVSSLPEHVQWHAQRLQAAPKP